MKNILRGNYLSKVQILGISRNRRMPDDEFLRNSIKECVELLVVDIKNRSIYLKYPRGYKLKTFPLHHYDEYDMVKKSRFGDCFKTFLHCIGDMNIDEIYKNYRFDLFVITAPNKDKSDIISDVLKIRDIYYDPDGNPDYDLTLRFMSFSLDTDGLFGVANDIHSRYRCNL